MSLIWIEHYIVIAHCGIDDRFIAISIAVSNPKLDRRLSLDHLISIVGLVAIISWSRIQILGLWDQATCLCFYVKRELKILRRHVKQ